MAGSHSFIGPDQIDLINISFDERVNNLVQMQLSFTKTERATTEMMDSFDILHGQFHKFPLIIPIESIFNSSDFVYFVDVLKHNGDLSNDGIHTRADTTQANYISFYFFRVEKLGSSWPCSHVFFLKLNAIARCEPALFDNKLARTDHSLWR